MVVRQENAIDERLAGIIGALYRVQVLNMGEKLFNVEPGWGRASV